MSESKQPGSGFYGGCLCGTLIATILFAGYVRYRTIAEKEAAAAISETTGETTDGEVVKVDPKNVIKLKLAHGLDPTHPVHKGMEYMGKTLARISGGKVQLEIYPSGQLGDETRCIEQLQNGALAMTKTSAAPMEGFVPAMAVFSLPYVFDDSDHYWRVLNGDIGRELLLAGESRELRGLCYYDGGSRNFYTTDKPIHSPDDLIGLKIRVQNSKTAMAMVTALGGSPTPIPWGELYTALQQGVVDGAENNPPSYWTNKHHEVCKFFCMDAHSRIPDMLMMSKKVWESLSPQVQAWVQEAADESSKWQRKRWIDETKKALESAKAEGVKVYYPDLETIAEFQKKVQPLLDSYQGSEVGDLIDRIKALR